MIKNIFNIMRFQIAVYKFEQAQFQSARICLDKMNGNWRKPSKLILYGDILFFEGDFLDAKLKYEEAQASISEKIEQIHAGNFQFLNAYINCRLMELDISTSETIIEHREGFANALDEMDANKDLKSVFRIDRFYVSPHQENHC